MSQVKRKSKHNGFVKKDRKQGRTVSFNPNSAEGKALQRIRHPISEEEWIHVFDPVDNTIDASEVDAWLLALNRTGWVSSEESSNLPLEEIYRTQKTRRGTLTREQLHLV